MNCKKILSRLNAFLDGEVPAKLMREMEEHLSTCPSCSSQVERIRRMDDVLDSFTVPPLPQGFSARVMTEGRRRAPHVKVRKPFSPLGNWRLQWLFDLSVPMRVAAFGMVLMAFLVGMFMSKELLLLGSHQLPVAGSENLDGFEWFGPTPPESLGSAYLTHASPTPEHQGAR
jgi:anti-sigma factor RsiW